MADPQGRLQTTSAASIAASAVVGLAIGGLLPPLFDRHGGVPPSVPWTAPFVLFVVAGGLFILAWSTWQALHRRRERMDVRLAFNLLVIAKASALAGAMVAGGYVGFAAHFWGSLDIELPRERVIHSAFACVAAILIVVGALLLERACRIPKDPDDSTSDGSGSGSASV